MFYKDFSYFRFTLCKYLQVFASKPNYLSATFGSKTGNTSDGKHGEDRFKWKQCYVCQGQHYVDECQRFRDMNPNERWKVVKDQRACFSCLKKGKGHTVANCSRRKPCGEKQQSDNICSKPHHKLLHVDASESKPPAHIGFTQDGSGTLLPVHVGQLKEQEQIKGCKCVLRQRCSDINGA